MYLNQEHRNFARELRNQPTVAEKRLWHFLRAQKLRNHKFRRQAAVGPYVVDFVCFALKLIIELDGPQHQEPSAIDHDTRRTAWFAARGYRVMRFRNQELDEDICGVVDKIESALAALQTETRNPPSPALPAEGREPD
jgi:5-methyltetrahydrofolate--homocysteine methyltransferase